MDCVPSAKTSARPFLFVERLGDALRRAEALLGQRGVPGEDVVLGDQDVGVAVAVEIDELQVGVARVEVQARREGAEGLPAFVVSRARRSRASGRPARPGRAGHRRPGPGTALPPASATLGLTATSSTGANCASTCARRRSGQLLIGLRLRL